MISLSIAEHFEKHSTSKDAAKKAARERAIEQACRDYFDLARCYLDRALDSLASLKNVYRAPSVQVAELETFCRHAERQIDQIRSQERQRLAEQHKQAA